MKILVVDDSVFARTLIIDMLKKNKYTSIIEASSGMEAIEKYTIEKPDIVLLDLIMENINGVEVVEKLISLDKNAKIIVISAVGQERILKHVMTGGAKAYLIKPVDEKRLILTIKKITG